MGRNSRGWDKANSISNKIGRDIDKSRFKYSAKSTNEILLDEISKFTYIKSFISKYPTRYLWECDLKKELRNYNIYSANKIGIPIENINKAMNSSGTVAYEFIKGLYNKETPPKDSAIIIKKLLKNIKK